MAIKAALQVVCSLGRRVGLMDKKLLKNLGIFLLVGAQKPMVIHGNEIIVRNAFLLGLRHQPEIQLIVAIGMYFLLSG